MSTNEKLEKETVEAKPTKRKVKKSWRKELADKAKFVVNVTNDPYSLERANNAGYTKADLKKALGLVEAIWEADSKCGEKRSEKSQQVGVKDQSMANLYEVYMNHVEKARTIFDPETDRGVYLKLILDGKRPKAFTERMHYVTKFYRFALEDQQIRDTFKQYNISEELMLQMLELAADALANEQATGLKMTESKRATKKRLTLEDEFHAWFKRFKGIYALTPEPKQLASTVAKTTKVKA
ncbi:hypothetical protein R9C00_17915 [Flammeovirgaceae bacterium SG7u.111]|nr:hypothetical protein [Flammeovirgaceae bacterium SG7u.132]WPO33581.1 hypothetical protein R9C00_17915 [Flammeovirgaceae bacterium SG7u.111]